MSKMDELRWIRVFTASHVPTYLVEQVKHRDYSVENFYKYQDSLCLRSGVNGPELNPFSHLYVLANKENLIKGFLWFSIDPLTLDMIIQTYSVDKEYWKDGGAVEKLCAHVKEIHRKAKLNKIYWITNYPKHSQRFGFKPSKSILMEYSEEKNGEDLSRGSEQRGEHRASDATAAAVSK